MTDDNSNLSPEGESNLVDMDDLDAFEQTFFNKEPVAAETPEEDTPEEAPEESDENEEVPSQEESEPEEVEDEEPEEEPQPKPKKNKTQERIEKLLERERLANERAEALEKRLAALEASKEVVEDKEPTLRSQLPAEAPSPDAVDDEGNVLYPLGEFDPKYIVDLTRFTVAQERKAAKEAEDKANAEKRAEAEKAEAEAARKEIQQTWLQNVEEVEKELPDLREKIVELTDTFQDIEPVYGEYLASAIMASEFGPQIMYYLSQNIGEAQKIVASGPAAATRMIGRIEARFEKPAPQSNKKRVSEAPEPPKTRTRGQGAKVTVAPDTDDLDAFEKAFFN